MRLLLDANAVLWWFDGDERLSKAARHAINAPRHETFVSVAAVWEIAIKTAIGKLNAQALLDNIEERFGAAGFAVLPISLDHALRAGSLPGHHKDPFDRLLIAQANVERADLVSADQVFHQYSVNVLW